MASQVQQRIPAIRPSRPAETSTEKAEQDFLASVMVSVSASLESMSEEQREQAVAAAESAVAHIQ
jgi:hypothetical protein